MSAREFGEQVLRVLRGHLSGGIHTGMLPEGECE